MKNWLFYFFICVGVHGWGQNDTTYLSDWEYNNVNYNQIIQNNPSLNLLDYASGIEREYIKKFRIDSLFNDTIVADDWIALYHAFNTINRSVNFEDSTLEFTKDLFSFWMNRTLKNEVLTLPIGVIFKQGKFIKDEKYNQIDLYFSQNDSNYGWNIGEGVAHIDELIENHDYFNASILYDETIFDQEIIFTFDTNFTVLSDKKIDHLELTIQNSIFEIYPNDSVKVYLNSETRNIKIGVYFKDSSYIENIQFFDTDTSYFENDEKSSPFTGGIHSFPESSDDLDVELTEDILFTIFTTSAPITSYKIKYGIIWGACNNTEKLRKPIFMLHGFRPTVQPWIPSLKKLYRTKFNFKGSQYGDDGFVDLLVKNGYDVVICRIDPGFMSIRLGARVLSKFFETVVEPQKLENESKFENIVLGFSMGGHYWRNMLMYDDHEHLNLGKERHHHTRMWIPMDSPLEGANNPLAHQFAAKSVAEHPAGFPVFNISYINMYTAGSQEQQRYDLNGTDGYDGAYNRFHIYRTNYIDEMQNTFYLGSSLTKYRGYPSSTRNIGISVGSNSLLDYYDQGDNNVPILTYDQNSFFPTLLGIKHWEVQLYRAYFISSATSAINDPQKVFKRKVYRTAFGSTNVLVDDHFETYNWHHLDNCNGSYLNSIKNNVNVALNTNSLLGFGAYRYKGNQVFVPTLSSLAINPDYWTNDMRFNLKSNKLMFDELTDNISNPNQQSDFFGYPHLGHPLDYQTITPMDAIFCDELTYEHITLIDDDENQNDQSELITFLLNEIQPWYLDLQNQNLGEYARPNYRYSAMYEARNVIRTGREISPKTPFGEYVVEANTDLELKAGQEIHLTSGTHIKEGAIAHLYIEELCYAPLESGKSLNSNYVKKKSNISNEGTALDNKQNELLFNVFPNPNNGTFTVFLNNNLEGKLYISNLQGQILREMDVENGTKITLESIKNFKGVVLLKFISSTDVQLNSKMILE